MPSMKSRVLKYIESNPGTNIYFTDVAEELGLTTHQISGVISHALRSNTLPGLERVADGIVRYSPNKAKVCGKLYEEIGRSKKGLVIVQDEEGNLYRVDEL